MQIIITPAAGGSPVALAGNLPAQGFQRLRQASQSQVQESLAIGAANAGQFLRGNKKQTLTFTTQFQLASAEAAAYFGPAWEAKFPIQGPLVYETDAGTLYMANAVASVTEIETLGATCTLTYRITGGGFYADAACTDLPSPPDPVA